MSNAYQMLITESNDIKDYYARAKQYKNELEWVYMEMNKVFMTNIIKPFCIKYGLSFKSYNGTWIFMIKSGKIIHLKKHNTTFWKRLNDINDMIHELDTETRFSGDGYWFENNNFEQPKIFNDMK